jgi:endonuclease V-like protein UPF0215 family
VSPLNAKTGGPVVTFIDSNPDLYNIRNGMNRTIAKFWKKDLMVREQIFWFNCLIVV